MSPTLVFLRRDKMRRIANWIKDKPILATLLLFMIVQVFINIVLVMRIIQTEELLGTLMTWRV